MPDTVDASQIRAAGLAVRRLPADLRRELGRQTRDDVAALMADAVRGGASGVYGPAIAATARARVSADPLVVIGGRRRILSGGATGGDLVWGAEWGGGGRSGRVRSSRRARAHTRVTTNQFRGARSPFIIRALRGARAETLDAYARAVAAVWDRMAT